MRGMITMRMRHPNGGGWVYGNDAYVTKDSYVSTDSTAYNECKVIQSTLKHSHVGNSAVVSTSTLFSVKAGGWTRTHKGELSFCSMSDYATIEGNERSVIVRGSENKHIHIGGRMWLDKGRWERAPRYVEVQSGNGTIVGVTECVEGHAHVGCMCKPLVDWLKNGTDYGKAAGWTENAVALIRKTFEEWADAPLPTV